MVSVSNENSFPSWEFCKNLQKFNCAFMATTGEVVSMTSDSLLLFLHFTSMSLSLLISNSLTTYWFWNLGLLSLFCWIWQLVISDDCVNSSFASNWFKIREQHIWHCIFEDPFHMGLYMLHLLQVPYFGESHGFFMHSSSCLP